MHRRPFEGRHLVYKLPFTPFSDFIDKGNNIHSIDRANNNY